MITTTWLMICEMYNISVNWLFTIELPTVLYQYRNNLQIQEKLQRIDFGIIWWMSYHDICYSYYIEFCKQHCQHKAMLDVIWTHSNDGFSASQSICQNKLSMQFTHLHNHCVGVRTCKRKRRLKIIMRLCQCVSVAIGEKKLPLIPP